MKTLLKASLLAGLSVAGTAPIALAEEEGAWGPITAGVTVTNDYRFRGVSQSDREAAVQPWIQYTHKSGLFVNLWGSNIDFNDGGSLTTEDSTIEIDITLGYNHEFSEQTTGSIKGVYYWYPDADYLPTINDYDYFELIAGLGHDFGKASVSGEVAWSPDYFGETGDAVSVKGGVSVPILEQLAFMGPLSASANVGYQWIDDNALYDLPDYLFYDIGASVEWEAFVIDVRWVDTDVSRANCFPATAANVDFCEGGVVLSFSANMPG